MKIASRTPPNVPSRPRDRLDTPAAPLNVARVESHQIRGKERRLVAARSGADLDDTRTIVQRIAGDEQRLQRTLDLFELGFQPFGLRTGHGGKLRIVPAGQFVRLG